MNHGIVVQILAAGILFGTPVLIAALGELLAERSGILNLGIEGMMLMGAVCGFWAAHVLTGASAVVLPLAILAAAVAGGLMAAIHAFMSVTLRANQIVSGVALTILAGTIGLSSYIGGLANLSGAGARYKMGQVDVLGLKDLPIAGPLVFHQNGFVYLSWLLTVLVAFYLYRTRPGMHVRAVGEEPGAARAMGISVTRYRYVHTIVGGCFAGVGGATLSLAISPKWSDGMTSGAGWIAIAVVIFSFWRPGLVLVGAYLFGVTSSLGFNLQARGVNLPSELFTALPYVTTIVALSVVSSHWAKRRIGAPKALAEPFAPEEA